MSVGLWRNVGRVPYREGLEIQERVAEERLYDLRADTLLLLEHPPTITLGRRGSRADVLWTDERLAEAGLPVERTTRGGLATYHGPGQLVGYVIARIGRSGRGVRAFVQAVESALGDAIGGFGLRAEVGRIGPGLWIGASKVASIGIAVRRGISRHGFALNVDMDLEPFRAIVPCGIPDLPVSDLSRAAGRRIGAAEARSAVLRAWSARFGDLEEEDVTPSGARVATSPPLGLRMVDEAH